MQDLDHKAEEVDVIGAMPDFSQLFDQRHTAGPANGKRTVALPVTMGNFLSPPSPPNGGHPLDGVRERLAEYIGTSDGSAAAG